MDKFIIRTCQVIDKPHIIDMMVKQFSYLMPKEEIKSYIDVFVNYDISIVATHNNNIIGFYLLGNRNIVDGAIDEDITNYYTDIKEYNNNGIEGVALMVDNNYRCLGVGSLLKDYIRSMDIDYIWGIQYKSLNNLDEWLKCRILVCDNDDVNITLEVLKNNK